MDQPDTPVFALDVSLAETSTVAWISEEIVVIGSSDEREDPDEQDEDYEAIRNSTRLHPNGLAVYDLEKREYTAEHSLGYPPGDMMPVGDSHVVTFYEHPRLVDLRDGAGVQEWRSISTGTRVSSITWGKPSPSLALDPINHRFAVVTENGIDVVIVGRTT